MASGVDLLRNQPPSPGVRARRYPETFFLFWALLFLLVFLGQQAFYRVDGQGLVVLLARGEGEHPLHPLFLPMARVLTALPRALGMSAFGALELLSAFGVAFGVFCAHRAAISVFGGERKRAFAAALLVAAAPSLFFFGTVVEFHGLFFAFAGLFFWAWVSAAELRGWWVLVPLLSALGAGVHATGHLLPLFVLLRLPRTEARPKRRGWVLLLHVLFFALLGLSLGSFSPMDWGDSLQRSAAAVWGPLPSLEKIWTFVKEEWFLPLFPLSLLFVVGFLAGRWKEEAAFLLVLSAYLLLSFFILDNQVEQGAYLLPLLFPASILTMRKWPRVLFPIILLLSLGSFGWGYRDIQRHDRPREAPGFVQGYLKLTGGKARLVLGNLAEAESILRRRPDLSFVPLYEFLARLQTADREGQTNLTQKWIQGLLVFMEQDLQKGMPVLWTRSCFRELDAGIGIASWGSLKARLKRGFRMRDIQVDGFEARLLLPSSPLSHGNHRPVPRSSDRAPAQLFPGAGR